MRFYCNKLTFRSMSGRHPDGKESWFLAQYAMMAIAGTPDGKEDFDPDMAAAYLRLISASTVTSGEEPEYVPQFTNAGTADGNFSF